MQTENANALEVTESNRRYYNRAIWLLAKQLVVETTGFWRAKSNPVFNAIKTNLF